MGHSVEPLRCVEVSRRENVWVHTWICTYRDEALSLSSIAVHCRRAENARSELWRRFPLFVYVSMCTVTNAMSRSKYLPVVALTSTEFEGQDPMGTGPGPPRPPVQFLKRALFLGWEIARAEATCVGDSLMLVHDETTPKQSRLALTGRRVYCMRQHVRHPHRGRW